MMTKPNSGDGRSEERGRRLGPIEQPAQHQDVEGEQDQRSEVEEVLGDAARLDVREVGEGLQVGRIREPHGSDDDDRDDHAEHAGQAGRTAPAAELAIGGRSVRCRGDLGPTSRSARRPVVSE